MSELGVHHVVVVARQAMVQPPPGREIVPGVTPALEMEHVHVYTRRPQEIRLSLDEIGGARLAGRRPVARDHQDANRRGHRTSPHRSPATTARSPPGSAHNTVRNFPFAPRGISETSSSTT